MASKAASSTKPEKKSLFTLPIILALVVLSVASASISYYLSKPEPKTNTKALSKFAVPMGDPIDRRDWRPYKGTDQHRYIEKHVFSYINKHQTPLKTCYFGYKGPEKLSPRGGVITVEFFIEKDGTITKPRVFRSEIKVKDVQQCVLGHVAKWKFPPHDLEKPIRYQTPFFFR
ncbi:MAG: AgmX/PglI C-terminal domain-containing protein [Myxococcales bacterium]|nr:AgmX/PglI C-terminal domain-containing protein [Myxococcales bacterium]